MHLHSWSPTIIQRKLTLEHSAYKGMFIPSCDEDGYYRKLQCDQSKAECWCVDLHGTEVTGSRVRGKPDCGEWCICSKSLCLVIRHLTIDFWETKGLLLLHQTPLSTRCNRTILLYCINIASLVGCKLSVSTFVLSENFSRSEMSATTEGFWNRICNLVPHKYKE